MGSPAESTPAAATAGHRHTHTDNAAAPTEDTASAGPASAAVEQSAELEIDFDITMVDGEAGRRLGILQAEVILDVLTWLHQHRRSAGSTS
jgi:hypothetical protein